MEVDSNRSESFPRRSENLFFDNSPNICLIFRHSLPGHLLLMSNIDSRIEAIEEALRNHDKLDLPLITNTINRGLDEAWGILNLTKSALPAAYVENRKRELYQIELLLLTVCKCCRDSAG